MWSQPSPVTSVVYLASCRAAPANRLHPPRRAAFASQRGRGTCTAALNPGTGGGRVQRRAEEPESRPGVRRPGQRRTSNPAEEGIPAAPEANGSHLVEHRIRPAEPSHFTSAVPRPLNVRRGGSHPAPSFRYWLVQHHPDQQRQRVVRQQFVEPLDEVLADIDSARASVGLTTDDAVAAVRAVRDAEEARWD